ncbi:MAG TPA: nicotinate-nucleotide--dimethylbenzimidazole phosphoribosyltransferase [Syntrophorhabdaceae bacterium]|nr:nicotinate-nucleotide--dimethylbenzimidazole phosphoribosyltransferase [Syntrophorhabdaceae bacterium]
MDRIHIEGIDPGIIAAAQQRLDSLTKPQGSLGRLEEFAKCLAGITGNRMPPLFEKKAIFTFAGDHGVTDEGISLFPKEVTVQMVYNFLEGGAGISVLARHVGAEVIVVDIGVDHNFDENKCLIRKKVVRGTKNMRKGPAMTRDEAVRTIETGIGIALQYAEKGYGLFGTGDMGIGNTTASSAIASVMTGSAPADVTGKGTGISDEALGHKVRVIEDAIALNGPNRTDPIDVLAKVGGAEIGGIAGLILGAASQRIPVVIDGLISTAGAIIAYGIEPACRDYMFAAHNSVEKGHRVMLNTMGLEPVLDLGLRLGEGTGAALAMSLIEAGLKIYREMATFDEAGVSKELT